MGENNRNAKPQNNQREHQWPFAKETHSIFGKEMRLVKNKQHKTAPKKGRKG